VEPNLFATTDSAGHFEITGLDAGQYQISADREGLVRQEYGRRTAGGRGTSISVTSGQRFMANFQMDAAGVIAGRVRDSSGEPIFRATVQAYTYQYSNGDRTLAQVASSQTDDLGQYRLFPLVPGDYFLSVTTQPEATGPSQVDASAASSAGARGGQLLAGAAQLGALQNSILQNLTQQASSAPTFYPGTIDPDAASAIHVAVSAEVRDINLNLRPIPGVTISGHLVAPFSLAQNANRAQQPNAAAGGRGANIGGAAGILNLLAGAAAQNAQVSLTRIGGARAGLAALFGRLNQVRVGADGAFEIRNVAPGSYFLNATASDNGQRYTGRIRLDVSSSDITTAAVEVHPGIEVRGQITLVNPPAQFKMSSTASESCRDWKPGWRSGSDDRKSDSRRGRRCGCRRPWRTRRCKRDAAGRRRRNIHPIECRFISGISRDGFECIRAVTLLMAVSVPNDALGSPFTVSRDPRFSFASGFQLDEFQERLWIRVSRSPALKWCLFPIRLAAAATICIFPWSAMQMVRSTLPAFLPGLIASSPGKTFRPAHTNIRSS
jgi:hypothetical protein